MPFLAAIPAWVGTAAALTGAAVTATSAIASGIQQKEAYEAQAKGADYNRAVANQAAVAADANAAAVARSEAAWEEQQREKNLRLQGAQKAGFGAAGVLMEGSPLDVLGQTVKDQEMDIWTQRYNYDVEAANYRNQASRFRSQAGFYDFETKRQEAMGDYAVGAGVLGAGTSLLTTGGALLGGLNSSKYPNFTNKALSSNFTGGK